MSRMPNFEAGYHKFTFKKARQEADLGCRSFDEPGPTPFTREDVSKFDLVDQRTMLALTGSRLLHNCHPRQVNTLAKMTSLHNAVKCLPGQEHRQANRLGDGYSKLESMKLMEGATASFDSPIVALKKGVESLYLNRSASSARALKALAGRLHVNGFSYLVDNVGLVGIIHTFCKRFASTDPGITSLQVLIHCNGTRK